MNPFQSFCFAQVVLILKDIQDKQVYRGTRRIYLMHVLILNPRKSRLTFFKFSILLRFLLLRMHLH